MKSERVTRRRQWCEKRVEADHGYRPRRRLRPVTEERIRYQIQMFFAITGLCLGFGPLEIAISGILGYVVWIAISWDLI
ncbi:MAG: hypothetical protein KAJ37_10810 [Candidatus Krumholzibacteria bacterium]|nr:hypothetical protein [Candidatus Krumholzibacteria bacterium]